MRISGCELVIYRAQVSGNSLPSPGGLRLGEEGLREGDDIDMIPSTIFKICTLFNLIIVSVNFYAGRGLESCGQGFVDLFLIFFRQLFLHLPVDILKT